MTDDEARNIVLRTWSEHFGGIEEVTRRPTLADDCRHAHQEVIDILLDQMVRECRKAAATRSYPAYWDHVTDRLPVIDWDEILKQPCNRPTDRSDLPILVDFCMAELIYGSITAYDAEPRMKVRTAARIVAEVLTSEGIRMTWRQVERRFYGEGKKDR